MVAAGLILIRAKINETIDAYVAFPKREKRLDFQLLREICISEICL